MVDFEAGAGFSMTGNQVDVDVNKLPDETVLDMLAEARAVALDRGLVSVAEGVGSLAIVASEEQTEAAGPVASVAVTSEMLIATVDESGQWYTKVAKDLNAGRRSKKSKVQVVPEDELAGRAEAWLSDERLRAAEEGLHYLEDKPLIIMPLPNTPVSHEEVVNTWADARGGKLWQWGGRMAFLKQWPADQLSGYDQRQSEDPVRFVAIETGYEADRQGDRDEQLRALKGVQARHPNVRSATIFEGGVLANRYSDETRPDWHDTYVRAIEVKPDSGGLFPHAYVSVDGGAFVDVSIVEGGDVSRRAVG